MKHTILTIVGLIFGLSAQAQQYHDAAAFDLKGNVKTCILESSMLGKELSFDRNGKMQGDYILKRNNKNYLITCRKEGASVAIAYSYDSNNRLKEETYIYSDQNGIGSTTFSWQYGSNGFVSKMTGWGKKNIPNITEYSNYKADAKGNWIERTVNGKKEHRTITYWDNTPASKVGINNANCWQRLTGKNWMLKEYGLYSNGKKANSFTWDGQYLRYQNGVMIWNNCGDGDHTYKYTISGETINVYHQNGQPSTTIKVLSVQKISNTTYSILTVSAENTYRVFHVTL